MTRQIHQEIGISRRAVGLEKSAGKHNGLLTSVDCQGDLG